MAEDRAKTSTGPNARPRNAPVAGTAPGIPDEARSRDAPLPDEPTEQEVRRAADALENRGPDER